MKDTQEDDRMTAKVYVVGNFKGGTSKTMISTMLAYHTATFKNERTLVIDMDTQSSATIKLAKTGNITDIDTSITDGYKEGNLQNQILPIIKNLDLIPCDSSFRVLPRLLVKYFPNDDQAQVSYLKKLIEPLREQYDRIFIDVPPSQSDYQDNAIMAADYSIIALQTQEPALLGADNYISYMNHIVDEYGADIQVMGIVPVTINDKGRSERVTLEQAKEFYGENVLNTVLTHQERLKVFESEGIHYTQLLSGNYDMWDERAHQLFGKIWDELLERERYFEQV